MRLFRLNEIAIFCTINFLALEAVGTASADQTNVKVLSSSTSIAINPYIHTADDPQSSWNLDEARARRAEFSPAFGKHNFGVTNGTIWIAFNIENQGHSVKPMYLEIDNPILNSIKVYQLNKEKVIFSETGSNIAYQKRPSKFYTPAILLNLRPNVETRIILAVTSKNPLQIPIFLKTPELMARSQNIKSQLFGLYYGAIFVLAIICIILLFLQKKLFYLLYLCLLTTTQFLLLPYVFGANQAFIFPNQDNLGIYFTSYVPITLMAIAPNFFALLFKEEQVSYIPKVKIITSIVWLSAAIYFWFFANNIYHVYVFPPLGLSIILITLYYAFLGIQDGSKFAKAYIIIVFGNLLGAASWFLQSWDYINLNEARIVLLSVHLFNAMFWLLILASTIRNLQNQQKSARTYIEKIDGILNNVPIGILSFGRNLIVQKEVSQYLLDLFKNEPFNICGSHILDIIFYKSAITGSERTKIIRALSSCIGHSLKRWEKQKEKMPNTGTAVIDKEPKFLELSWTPILNKSQKVGKILLTIEDLTEKQQLQDKRRRQQLQTAATVQVLAKLYDQNVDHFRHQLNRSRNLIDKICNATRKGAVTNTVSQDLDNLYSCSQSLKIPRLKVLVLSASQLIKVNNAKVKSTDLDIATTAENIRSEIALYEKIFNEVYDQRAKNSREEGYNFLSKFLANEFGKIARQINRIDKKVKKVKCFDEVIQWPHEILSPTKVILTAAINNWINSLPIPENQETKIAGDIELGFSAKIEQNHLKLTIDCDHNHTCSPMIPMSSIENITNPTFTEPTLQQRQASEAQVKIIANDFGGFINQQVNQAQNSKVVISLPIKEIVREKQS